jgi:hypothetical protein
VSRADRFRFPEGNGALYLVIEAMGRANVGQPDDLLSAAGNLEAASELCRKAAEAMRLAAEADRKLRER